MLALLQLLQEQLKGCSNKKTQKHCTCQSWHYLRNFIFITLVSNWKSQPSSTLIFLIISTAPNSIAPGFTLPLSTNHINYTNPWEIDLFFFLFFLVHATQLMSPSQHPIWKKAADSAKLWNKNRGCCKEKKHLVCVDSISTPTVL